MNKHKQQHNEPWEQDSYRTGSTRPPKDRGGIIAVLLVALILVGGLCSALGFLNVRLLQMLQLQADPSETLSVFDEDATQPTSNDAPHYTAPEKVTLSLEAPPQEMPETPDRRSYPWLVKVACGPNISAGVVMSENGYIITGTHILGADPIAVTFAGGMQLSATLVGTDETFHVAVLHVTAKGLTPAPFGDSDYLREGDGLFFLGEELNNHTFTADRTDYDLHHTAVVLNRYGQVVAFPTFCEDESHLLMTGRLKPAVDRILADALFRKGHLELTGQTVSVFDRRFYGLPQGVLVTQVEAGGCADAAGVRSGDVITGLDGAAVTTWKDLQNILSRMQAGQTVTLDLYRHQSQQNLTVTITLSEEEK